MRKIPAVDVEPPSVDPGGFGVDTVVNFVTERPEVVVIAVITALVITLIKKPFVRGGLVIGSIVAIVVYVLMSGE